MKKEIIFGLVLSVIFMIPSACGEGNDENPVEERPYLQLSNGNKVPINVQYIRTAYFPDVEYPLPFKITFVSSTGELEQYYEKNRQLIYDGHDGSLMPDEDFLNAIEQYFDDYFTDNFLVIVGLTENSGSIEHKVERVDENGDIVIKKLSLEGAGTPEMSTWSIVIEINNNFKREQYQVVLAN